MSWIHVPGKVYPLTPLNIQDIKKQILESSEEDSEDDDLEKASENNDTEGVGRTHYTNNHEAEKVTSLNCQSEKLDQHLNNVESKIIYSSPKEIETKEQAHRESVHKTNFNFDIKEQHLSNYSRIHVPGKVYPLPPLNIQDIKKQILENSEEDSEDDDLEKVSENSDTEGVGRTHYTNYHEAEKVTTLNCQSEKQDQHLNNIESKIIYSSAKEIQTKEQVHRESVHKRNLNFDIKEQYLSNYSSFSSPLEPVLEDATVQIEYKETFQKINANKENVSCNIEPINLSKSRRKIEDSFDLNLSASLHTPLKKKDKPFNCITPQINIIPPSEARSINKTGSISKNVYGLKNLFKTPKNKPVVSLQYSAKKQGMPYQSHKIFTSHQNGIPETSEPKDSTLAVLHSQCDGFDRITINTTEYIVMNLLGRGGSSEVFHCFNLEEKAHVAIKMVSLSEPTTAEGYINEVKLLESLQGCDRIITMYDYEIRDEQLMVVLENGAEDLSTILKELAKKQSHLPLYMLIYYWMEMLYAVQQIHSNGVIHSDLKPANFLRANSGLKLIDFGIASKVQEDMTCVFKSNQEGSCNYISPEALNVHTNGNVNSPNFGKPKYKVHFKSDVWSLGCILYQLVYRKTPFQHLNPIWSKLAAIVDPNYKIEYPNIDWVPVRIVNTIKRCLKVDIKSRPSVDELIQEYEGILRI